MLFYVKKNRTNLDLALKLKLKLNALFHLQTIYYTGTLHEMLDMVLLLLCMWNESRHRNDSNSFGGSPYSSAPLVRFLRRIERIGRTNEQEESDEIEGMRFILLVAAIVS